MASPHMIPPAAPGAGLDRRALLKGAGVLLAAFALPLTLAGRPVLAAPGPVAVNAFISLDREGGAVLTIPNVEMGQGIQTAVAMLIAEELDLPLARVTVRQAPADDALYANPAFGFQATGGSTSIRTAWLPMRQAGAVARARLVRAAADRWGVDPAACTTASGTVHGPDGRQLGYADVAEAAAALPEPEGVPLRDPGAFTVIGHAARRLEGRDKVTGKATFGIDASPAGLAFAAIAICPHLGGRVRSVDDAEALAVRGVRQVVTTADTVAVVAAHTGAALKGLALLAIDWEPGPQPGLATADVAAGLRKAVDGPAVTAAAEGGADAILAAAARRHEAVYEMPFLAHAAMEPLNCTVDVRADACEVWVGSQIVSRARSAAAAAAGLPPGAVTIHNHLVGGGFGRRLEEDMVGRAVAIAARVKGPVQVVWPREEDMRDHYFRPYYLSRLIAALGDDGQPTAFLHRVVGPSIVARWIPPGFQGGLDGDILDAAAGPYRWPAHTIDFVRKEQPEGLVPSWWRGVGVTRNAFMVEGFVDELANLAGADPLAFRKARLAHDPRALNVLELAAAAAGWGEPLPAGEGRGIAVIHGFGTYVAEVAHVAVDDGGTVRVLRVTCAVDCGQQVNPDTIRAQAEGGIVFGLSAALYGEITIADGQIEQGNFDTYPVLRIDEAPVIEVILVDSREAPGGMGEPTTAAIAPAVVNAVHAATGQRLRRLPVGQVEPAN